jgi:uncharacterized protein (TIGR00369 family)
MNQALTPDASSLSADANEQSSASAFVDSVPYARSLGIIVENTETGLVCRMPYAEIVAGLGGLHGGAIATLLEFSTTAALLQQNPRATLQVLSFTVAFLRAARREDAIACAYITRQGRRIANLRAEAWQRERSRLIATAEASFVLQ